MDVHSLYLHLCYLANALVQNDIQVRQIAHYEHQGDDKAYLWLCRAKMRSGCYSSSNIKSIVVKWSVCQASRDVPGTAGSWSISWRWNGRPAASDAAHSIITEPHKRNVRNLHKNFKLDHRVRLFCWDRHVSIASGDSSDIMRIVKYLQWLRSHFYGIMRQDCYQDLHGLPRFWQKFDFSEFWQSMMQKYTNHYASRKFWAAISLQNEVPLPGDKPQLMKDLLFDSDWFFSQKAMPKMQKLVWSELCRVAQWNPPWRGFHRLVYMPCKTWDSGHL